MSTDTSKFSQLELLQIFINITNIRLKVVNDITPANYYVWVDTVKQNIKFCGLNDETAILAIRDTLEGICRTGFLSYLCGYRTAHAKEPSLEEVFKHFSSQYDTPLIRQARVQNILQRPTYVQSASEIAATFYENCEILFNMTAEEWVIQAYIHRLPPDLAIYTLEENPTSLNDAIAIATSKERLTSLAENRRKNSKGYRKVSKPAKRNRSR